MRYEDENIWLTQQMMAELYNVDVRTVNFHIKNIYSDGELTEDSTIRKYRIVQFNLKHILLPVDAAGFLRATRNCNISALILYVVMAAFVACSAVDNSRLTGILSLLMSLAVFGITISAIRGGQKNARNYSFMSIA